MPNVKPIRIAVVGDYLPEVTAHLCIPGALALAGQACDIPVMPSWVETRWLGKVGVTQTLEPFDGVWCVPNSPYRDQQAVLDAITYARTTGTPYLGTCGGFQHAIIEFARNGLGMTQANSVEDQPETAEPVINQLACALREVSDTISLTSGSKLADIYGQTEISEAYNCGFGFNPDYESTFATSPLQIVGRDDSPKAVELRDHPFFVATAFQPERSALAHLAHPLVSAFVRAAAS